MIFSRCVLFFFSSVFSGVRLSPLDASVVVLLFREASGRLRDLELGED